jgi:hypothetical protein
MRNIRFLNIIHTLTVNAKLEMFCAASKSKKSKVIPVTGLGGLYGCEMLGIPHSRQSAH